MLWGPGPGEGTKVSEEGFKVSEEDGVANLGRLEGWDLLGEDGGECVLLIIMTVNCGCSLRPHDGRPRLGIT